jgi:flagellar protein FlbD
MVTLTKLNGSTVVINAELIETIETTPDTIITLTNGKKYLVKERADDVVERVIEYKRRAMKDMIYYREKAGA